MRTVIAIAVSLLTLTIGAVAADQDAEFERANKLFLERDYKAAAEAYGKILESGFVNAAVEYNLGNALYRLGRIGEARLHFERASRLAPTDADVRANIEIIEKRYLEPSMREENIASPERVLRGALSGFPPALTLLAGIVAFLLLNMLLALRLIAPRAVHNAVHWTALISLGVIATLAFVIVAGQAFLAESKNYGIIVAPDAGVASEPAADAPSSFPAPQGVKVQIGRSQGGWVEIVLPNNAKGWVPAKTVEII